jgi:hypothetical protein
MWNIPEWDLKYFFEVPPSPGCGGQGDQEIGVLIMSLRLGWRPSGWVSLMKAAKGLGSEEESSFFELGSGGGPNSLGGYRGTLEKTMVRVCVSSLHSSTHLGWSLK